MDYDDFVKPGELDNLPDDPQMAFAAFVRLVRPRLAEYCEQYDTDRDREYVLVRDARHTFHAIVMGAADQFGIEAIQRLPYPDADSYSNTDFLRFRSELARVIAQIELSGAQGERANSFPLSDHQRKKLLSYVYHLHEAIDKAGLPLIEKERLHDDVTKLAEEAKRPRFRMIFVATLLLHVAVFPGEVGASYDTVRHLVRAIATILSTAKDVHDEQRRLAAEQPVALLPGRERKRSSEPPRAFERTEMDDEIPF